MNKDTVKGEWKQLAGSIKSKWGKLTDDDLTRAKGDGEYLAGKLQQYYGLSKDKAKDGLRELGYQFRAGERRVKERRSRDDDVPTERAADRL